MDILPDVARKTLSKTFWQPLHLIYLGGVFIEVYIDCGFPAEAWLSPVPVVSLRNLTFPGHCSCTLHGGVSIYVRWVYTSPFRS